MKSKSIQNVLCLFLFLLSGIVFSGIGMGAEPVSALASGISGAVSAFVICSLCIRLKRNIPKSTPSTKSRSVMCLAAAFFACLICAGNLFSFAGTLEDISGKLSGARFSHFFIILCIFLGEYCAKRGFESFSRICLIMAVPVVLPYVVSWFAFIGYSTPVQAVLPTGPFLTDAETFFMVFSICIQLTVFLTAFHETGIVSAGGLRLAFGVFLAVLFAESVKYFLFFGARGVTEIQRPDRTMLAAVPFVNVQDLFVFSYFFAFMLRNTALFAAASKLAEKAFPAKKDNIFFKAAPGVVSYVLYVLCLALPKLRAFSVSAVPPIAFAASAILSGFAVKPEQNK